MAKKAFTLIEILIAMAILVIVVSSTLAIFRASTNSWRKGELRAQRYQTARFILERISREITSIIPSSKNSATCFGEADKFCFIASISDAAASSTEIGYWLDEIAGQLIRADQSPPDYDFSTFSREEPLSEDVSALAFSYYDGEAWLDAWDSQAGAAQAGLIPKAVKVVFTVSGSASPIAEEFSTVIMLATSKQ